MKTFKRKASSAGIVTINGSEFQAPREWAGRWLTVRERLGAYIVNVGVCQSIPMYVRLTPLTKAA